MGLGLPVVLGVVKTHDGCVTVLSEPGQGSVFRVYLPLTDAEVPRLKIREAETTANLEAGTVLLVQDDEAVRQIAASMLECLGMTVLEAGDGVEALEVFQRHGDEIRCALAMVGNNI